MRLIKIPNLLNRWSSLMVYEEIDLEKDVKGQEDGARDSLQKPYIDVDDGIWSRTVVISW
jgi:hypothetical protein